MYLIAPLAILPLLADSSFWRAPLPSFLTPFPLGSSSPSSDFPYQLLELSSSAWLHLFSLLITELKHDLFKRMFSQHGPSPWPASIFSIFIALERGGHFRTPHLALPSLQSGFCPCHSTETPQTQRSPMTSSWPNALVFSPI